MLFVNGILSRRYRRFLLRSGQRIKDIFPMKNRFFRVSTADKTGNAERKLCSDCSFDYKLVANLKKWISFCFFVHFLMLE